MTNPAKAKPAKKRLRKKADKKEKTGFKILRDRGREPSKWTFVPNRLVSVSLLVPFLFQL